MRLSLGAELVHSVTVAYVYFFFVLRKKNATRSGVKGRLVVSVVYTSPFFPIADAANLSKVVASGVLTGPPALGAEASPPV